MRCVLFTLEPCTIMENRSLKADWVNDGICASRRLSESDWVESVRQRRNKPWPKMKAPEE